MCFYELIHLLSLYPLISLRFSPNVFARLAPNVASKSSTNTTHLFFWRKGPDWILPVSIPKKFGTTQASELKLARFCLCLFFPNKFREWRLLLPGVAWYAEALRDLSLYLYSFVYFSGILSFPERICRRQLRILSSPDIFHATMIIFFQHVSLMIFVVYLRCVHELGGYINK